MIGFAGMMLAIPALYWGWPPWVACLFTFALCAALGTVNGYLVIRTACQLHRHARVLLHPAGLSLALSTMLTGKTILSNNEGVALRELATERHVFSTLFSGHVLTGLSNAMARWGGSPRATAAARSPSASQGDRWWLLLTASAASCSRARAAATGSSRVGGDANAAKNTGVPGGAREVSLFVVTALARRCSPCCRSPMPARPPPTAACRRNSRRSSPRSSAAAC
jgi:simple sugar transport system permease protein